MVMDLAQTPRNVSAPYLQSARNKACMNWSGLQSIAVCCNAVWREQRGDSANMMWTMAASPTKDFADPHAAMGWAR
jgi:hypothetical protein